MPGPLTPVLSGACCAQHAARSHGGIQRGWLERAETNLPPILPNPSPVPQETPSVPRLPADRHPHPGPAEEGRP